MDLWIINTVLFVLILSPKAIGKWIATAHKSYIFEMIAPPHNERQKP